MVMRDVYTRVVRMIFRPSVMAGFGTGILVSWRTPPCERPPPGSTLAHSIQTLLLYSVLGGLSALCFPVSHFAMTAYAYHWWTTTPSRKP